MGLWRVWSVGTWRPREPGDASGCVLAVVAGAASGAGRMDVLIRALMASLMTSHGFRKDSEIILHLWGGPGPKRRLKIIGNEVTGLHAEERSIAGQIAKILREPVPPIGSWTKRSSGIYDSGGSIQETIRE